MPFESGALPMPPSTLPRDRLPLDIQLALEPVSLDHVPSLWHVVKRDRDVFRHTLSWLDGIPTQDACAQSMVSLVERWDRGEVFYFSLVVEGNAAGLIGLDMAGVAPMDAELAYWLGTHCQGRGIATRAGHAVLDLAWQALARQSLYLDVLPHNLASRRVAEKLGFREDAEAAPALDMYGQQRMRLRYRLQRPMRD